MGARQRLNGLYLLGALLIAAVIGGSAQSWLVFFVVAGVLVAILIHGGDIRLQKSHRHRRRDR